ncbi:unnamed protein product [Spirodela intermedia]|uniref:Nascent polypeptide-associated complex subunit beta n=1 Tax=Spirodela intermedia TaxID=51605 RepID=A0A7I8ILU6_SPIIN|nr:unnamed protein product [Spirodela intermedia]CAA6658808.1 unnamed protein product [Spirodela intermedia]
MNREKLMKMAGAVRTGGKGSVRRRQKASNHSEENRGNVIPSIEEVNIFKDDVVIQFLNPKVQASIPANTWVVSGSPQTKLQDLLPGIIKPARCRHLIRSGGVGRLGADNIDNLRRLAEQFSKQSPGAAAAAAAGGEEEDDDVPDLVEGETFEAAAAEGESKAAAEGKGKTAAS